MKMSDILYLRTTLPAGVAEIAVPIAARPTRRTRGPKCGMAWEITGLIVLLGMSTPAPAQNVAPATAPEKVIISSPPQGGSRLRAALAKLLGKDQRQKLSSTKTEVWTVAQSRVEQLKARFKALGVKVTQLRQDWNHILRRQPGPLAMTPAQEVMMRKAQDMREVVGVGVMRAPEAAVAEYALTAADASKGAGGSQGDDQAGKIVIPLNDKQHVTVERIKAVTSEKGTTWRGLVEETGESAV